MRYSFLVNPIAGARHQGASIATRLEQLLNESGKDYTVLLSKHPGHLNELARASIADGDDIIVVVGGDGSVNEVASALVNTDCKLGIIPCGSGNGLARHLRLPFDTAKALDKILEGKTEKIDAGEVSNRGKEKYFFCTMGVGFDAKVGMDYAQSGRRGLLTYATKALEDFAGYQSQEYELTINGELTRISASIITIANANQWGNNFHIAPKASLNDGLFDITVVKTLKNLHALDMPIEALGYTLDKNPDVLSLRGSSVSVSSENPGWFHIDGEPFIWDGSPIQATILPGALKIIK